MICSAIYMASCLWLLCVVSEKLFSDKKGEKK